MTTPLTTSRPNPRSSNSWRSSTAISSAVRSRCEVTRQSAASRSPSNRAIVTFVLPTSTARSTAGTLPPEGGRFPAYRLRPPADVEAPSRDRRPRIRRGLERAVSNLPADRLVRLTERHSRADEVLGRVRGQEKRVGRRLGEPVAVEDEVPDQEIGRLDRLERVLDRGEQGRLVLLEV